MTTAIIDKHGRMWSAHSREIRLACDSPYSGWEFSNYSINNLGFIGIHEMLSSCQVKLRPELVGQASIRALADWLVKKSFSRFVLSLHCVDGPLEFFTSRWRLLERIESAIEATRNGSCGNYLAELDPAGRRPAVVALLDLLRQNPPDLSDAQATLDLSARVREVFTSRFVIAKANPSGRDIVFNTISDELFDSFVNWRSISAIGLPVADLPDKGYGEWVQQSYENAMTTQEMVCEKVDVIVSMERMGRMRYRYSRTLLPFNDASGTPMLVSGSIDDKRIDLRIGHG